MAISGNVLQQIFRAIWMLSLISKILKESHKICKYRYFKNLWFAGIFSGVVQNILFFPNQMLWASITDAPTSICLNFKMSYTCEFLVLYLLLPFLFVCFFGGFWLVGFGGCCCYILYVKHNHGGWFCSDCEICENSPPPRDSSPYCIQLIVMC